MKAKAVQHKAPKAFKWIHEYHNPLTMEEIRDRILGACYGGLSALYGFYFAPFLRIMDPATFDLGALAAMWTAIKGIIWIVAGAYGGSFATSIAKDHYNYAKPKVKAWLKKKFVTLKIKFVSWKNRKSKLEP